MKLVATASELLSRRLGLALDLLGTDAVKRALGVVFPNARPDNPELMTARLMEDESKEWQVLVDEVVVPETWFFRHRESFHYLTAYVTEKWCPAHPEKNFCALCVPCASGEEPYSIAMALMISGLKGSRIQIDAGDISERLLARATQAIYGKASFREKLESCCEEYFNDCEEGWQVREEITRLIRFEKANLLDLSLFRHRAPYDTIFCRNALIYLNDSARHKVVRSLRELLDEEGLVFTGPSELTHFCRAGFLPVDCAQGFACRKEQPKQVQHSPPRPHTAVATSRLQRPATARQEPPPNPGRPAETCQSPQLLPGLEKAEQLADSGDLAGATTICKQLLQGGIQDPKVYSLLGVIEECSGALQTASEFFRKALYLSPNHYESLLHMSLICDQRGDVDSARLYRARARRALSRQEGRAVLKR